MRNMVITHHGAQCFKVTFGDLTLVFDPISKSSSFPAVRFGADIALVSRNHADMNGIEQVTYAGKEPFAITGPGEYEHSGVVIHGFLSKSTYGLAKGQEETVNTIYTVDLEDMTMVHLGALCEEDLPTVARESIDDIDVLFVPIGGNGTLSADKAYELAVSLEPKIIVPMGWSQNKGALENFLKETGTVCEEVDKLTLKKKDLLGRDGSILVIQP